MKPSPLTQFYDSATLGKCESANRHGEPCVRNAFIEKKWTDGKGYKRCRAHQKNSAFRPWKPE